MAFQFATLICLALVSLVASLHTLDDLQITIPGTKDHDEGRVHYFGIEVTQQGQTWVVKHRYREFDSLKNKLAPNIHNSNFPPKWKAWVPFFSIDERRKQLEAWLQNILRHPQILSGDVLMEFLRDEGTLPQATQQKPPNQPPTTPDKQSEACDTTATSETTATCDTMANTANESRTPPEAKSSPPNTPEPPTEGPTVITETIASNKSDATMDQTTSEANAVMATHGTTAKPDATKLPTEVPTMMLGTISPKELDPTSDQTTPDANANTATHATGMTAKLEASATDTTANSANEPRTTPKAEPSSPDTTIIPMAVVAVAVCTCVFITICLILTVCKCAQHRTRRLSVSKDSEDREKVDWKKYGERADDLWNIYESRRYAFPLWSKNRLASGELEECAQTALVYCSKEDDFEKVQQVATEREPVNKSMTRSYKSADLQKKFGYQYGAYRLSTEHMLMPNIAIYTKTPITDGTASSCFHVISAIGFAFDTHEQPDFRYFFKNDDASKKVAGMPSDKWEELVGRMSQMWRYIFECAKQHSLKRVYLASIGGALFKGPLTDQQYDELKQASLQPVLDAYPNIECHPLPRIPDWCFSEEGQKHSHDSLLVNAWDPWSMVGNGNEADHSLDGFFGRSSALAVLSWPSTNPLLKYKPI